VTEAVTTSTERNTEVVLRLFEALDRKQFDVVESLLSPDFTLHSSGQHLNRDQMMDYARAVYDAFSDLQHEIHETLAVGDRVVVRCTDRGTHTGDFDGTPASGRPIELDVALIARIAGGQIVEMYEYVDTLVLKQQLGAIST
jgi:steroid delta-isomerase-like uncharacterized protein